MLVEEAQIEMEDPLADGVQAEVSRLDDACVGGADCDLMHAPAADGNTPVARVVHQGTQWLVAREVDSVEVVRLALGPGRRRGNVDDAGHPGVRRHCQAGAAAVSAHEHASDPATAVGVEGAEPGTALDRRLNLGAPFRVGHVPGQAHGRLLVISAVHPGTVASHAATPTSTPRAAPAAAVSGQKAAEEAPTGWATRALPKIPSILGWASPTKPRATRTAPTAATTT